MENQNKQINIHRKSIIIGIIVGSIITFLVMLLFKNDKIDSLLISTEEGQGLKIELKSKKPIQDTKLLDSMWKNNSIKRDIKYWFKQKNYINPKEDKKLIIDHISKLNPKDTISVGILELRKNRQGPFQILSDSATISIPDYKVPSGIAYTWKGSEYAGDTLIVIDTDYKKEALRLICDDSKMGAKPPKTKYGYNFFHVNREDFIKLMGGDKTIGTVFISTTSSY